MHLESNTFDRAYLLEQEPITTVPDARFRLQHLIEEARAKIRDQGCAA